MIWTRQHVFAASGLWLVDNTILYLCRNKQLFALFKYLLDHLWLTVAYDNLIAFCTQELENTTLAKK